MIAISINNINYSEKAIENIVEQATRYPLQHEVAGDVLSEALTTYMLAAYTVRTRGFQPGAINQKCAFEEGKVVKSLSCMTAKVSG